MTDNLTKEQRTKCMKNIRSQWTSIELFIHNYLKGNKIKHEMHPDINGSPDLIIKDKKTAIFIHGCFWHKCPKCYKEPKSNKEYWLPKIDKNVKRDRRNTNSLKKQGFKVITYWEHDLKGVNRLATINKILKLSRK